MPVLVHAIEEAVRRIGAQRYDQRDGRDERDQAIATETRAQEPWTMGQWNHKPSLRAASGQPERSGGNPKKRQVARRGTTWAKIIDNEAP